MVSETTIAIVRSRLHIAFLEANLPGVDVVAFRDEYLSTDLNKKFGERALYLGRERVPTGNIRDIISAMSYNKAYYRGVHARLASFRPQRIILFLESEPLEKYIVGIFPGINVELWEEGLSHYLQLNEPIRLAGRALAQMMIGYYPGNVLRRRMNRSKLIVRDRYVMKNLAFPYPADILPLHTQILFIGSPLVGDRWLSGRRFKAILIKLVEMSRLTVRYLPHPREQPELVREVSAMTRGRLSVVEGSSGLLRHVAENNYLLYASVLSSGILDVGCPSRSAFVAPLFGLRRASDQLARSGLGIRIVDSFESWRELTSNLYIPDRETKGSDGSACGQ